jgi:hypothetical protein
MNDYYGRPVFHRKLAMCQTQSFTSFAPYALKKDRSREAAITKKSLTLLER